MVTVVKNCLSVNKQRLLLSGKSHVYFINAFRCFTVGFVGSDLLLAA